MLDGGSLWIEIVTNEKGILKKESSGNNRVIMTGPVTKSFSGQLSDLLSQVEMS